MNSHTFPILLHHFLTLSPQGSNTFKPYNIRRDRKSTESVLLPTNNEPRGIIEVHESANHNPNLLISTT